MSHALFIRRTDKAKADHVRDGLRWMRPHFKDLIAGHFLCVHQDGFPWQHVRVHIAAYTDGTFLPSKLRIAGVVSLLWLAFDIVRHETSEKGTSRHRLDPSNFVMHYKGVNVTLEIVIGEGCWNAESAAIVKSRPTFQADGDFAGGAKDPCWNDHCSYAYLAGRPRGSKEQSFLALHLHN